MEVDTVGLGPYNNIRECEDSVALFGCVWRSLTLVMDFASFFFFVEILKFVLFMWLNVLEQTHFLVTTMIFVTWEQVNCYFFAWGQTKL